jgi:glycosyltransferase involved in cell wall biosynthesis
MGGAETSLVELLAGLRSAEPSWELRLATGEDGPLVDRARALGVPVEVLPFPAAVARLGDAVTPPRNALWRTAKAGAASVVYGRRLAKLIRSIRPQIVQTNGFKMHVLGAWAASRQVPVVWHIHDYVSTRPLMRRLLGCLSSRCAAIIANSVSVAGDVRALLPAVPVTPIYNAVDMGRFTPAGSTLDLDALCGLPPAPDGTVRAGLVATFARWKGQEVFLEALSRLPPQAAVRGYIIGGPIYQTGGSQWSPGELRERCAKLGLEGRAGFTGFLENTPAAMRALDIVVHASTRPEPFGMAIVEAMACGRAVIASAAGGALEIIEDGENALSHRPGDADDLARQILRLAGSEPLRRRLGQSARGAAERRFHGRRLAEELTALYRRVSCAAPGFAPGTFSPTLQR